MESWSDLLKGGRGRALYASRKLRVAMIQIFASPGRAFDKRITFTEPCFQISLVKIPSYNKCRLRIWFPVYIESNEVLSGPSRCLLGGDVHDCDYNRR